MKKAIIIGCPGSGKSTFGRRLKEITGLPLCHLDMLYWNKDGTTVERSVFLNRLEQVLCMPQWIIDGNYGATMEQRFKACDTVFFLDYSTEVCLEGIEERRGKQRSDMPYVESDTKDEAFISFIQNYNKESRPKVLSLLQAYSDKEIIIFHTREESKKYLVSLQQRLK